MSHMSRKMTEDQSKKIIEWLKSIEFGKKPCPMCGCNTFILNDEFGLIQTGYIDGSTLNPNPNRAITMIITFCYDCGFVRNFREQTVLMDFNLT